jgi:hypothetical protein
MTLRYLLSLAILGLLPFSLYAQATVSATASSGGAYSVFTTARFGIEGPDDSSSACQGGGTGNHQAFGEHVTQAADAELGQNVFEFHSHIDDDNDRCVTFDRVRMEIKGGPSGQTDPDLEHDFGVTSYYRWQFRLPTDFVGANTFCHLFQLKAQGGTDSGFPVLTLTARADRVEFRHDAGDENTAGDQGSVASSPLSNFQGKWVEVAMEILHENVGSISMTVNDVATGTLLMSYANANIDLFRGNNGEGVINRPKWGIYRSLNASASPPLKDEIVRFANFCSSETSADLCPSLLPMTGTPDAVTDALPVDGADFVPLSMPIVWTASTGATSYNVYFGTTSTPGLVQTVSAPAYSPTLAVGVTYYYQIGAVSGAEETLNAVKSFTTLATSDGDWKVARGHARPNVEASDFFEFFTFASGMAEIDETTAIPGESGNIQHTFFSTEGTTGNHYWRYRPESEEQVTVVVRLQPLLGNNSITYFDFRSLGFRQKVRINRSTMRFEQADEAEDAEDFNGYWDDEEFHTIRLTFANNPDSQQAGIITNAYLDESTTPFATKTSTTTSSSNYLNIGRAGGDNYGANLDFIAINPTGVYPPMTPSAELPADLLASVPVSTIITENGRPVILSPNPTSGQISLLNLPEGTTSFRVFSVMGQEVSSGSLAAGSSQLNLGKLPRGTYLLRLMTESGMLETMRFVKQ